MGGSWSKDKGAGDPLVVVTLSVLILIGGLGFPVLANLYRSMRRLTLHSKLVLVVTVVLLALGVASVAVLEWTNPATLGGNPIGTRSLMALFQGVTPRTAGFSTVDYASMREPTLLFPGQGRRDATSPSTSFRPAYAPPPSPNPPSAPPPHLLVR